MMHKHRRAHALIWTILALLLPVVLLASLLAGSHLPADAPPVRLDTSAEGGSG